MYIYIHVSYIIFILIVLICVYLLSQSYEHFDNYYLEDIYDTHFVNLYEIIYRDNSDIEYDFNIIDTHTLKPLKQQKSVSILIVGSGVGKTCNFYKLKKYNVIGIDYSKNMVDKSRSLYPNIKFINENILNFDENIRFTHIIIDERMLYYNKPQQYNLIFNKIYSLLYNGGFLIVPVYINNKLQVAARYYSSNYRDTNNNLHGITNLTDFEHDCWYMKHNNNDIINNNDVNNNDNIDNINDNDIINNIDNINDNNNNVHEVKDAIDNINMNDDNIDDKYKYIFYDKIVNKNKKKRIKQTIFYFPDSEYIYNSILTNGFNLIHIENIHRQIIGGYELAIFRKINDKTNMNEILYN